MYKYEYETVSCDFGGWRYVGYIPTKQRGTGHTQELDLIFEKVI